MSTELSEQALFKAKTAVDDLYRYRNEYLGDFVDKYNLFNESDELWLRSGSIGLIIKEAAQLVRAKNERLHLKFDSTMALLNDLAPIFANASAKDKAEFCYLNGRSLNAIQSDTCFSTDGENSAETSIDSQALHWLTRALKFNPDLVDAWCELGDTCWRLGNPIEAENHFRRALKIAPTHVEALCQLSMVLRHLPESTNLSDTPIMDTEETVLNKSFTTTAPLNNGKKDSMLQESLQLAHKAVAQNLTDGRAWSVLGNALLTIFFTNFGSVAPPPLIPQKVTSAINESNQHTEQSEDPHVVNSKTKDRTTSVTSSQLIMTRCLAAYTQAAKDRCTALQPDFHYNRGLAWHYQDLFSHTLRFWLRTLCLDPDWQAPRICIQRLLKFIIESSRILNQYSLKTNKEHTELLQDSMNDLSIVDANQRSRTSKLHQRIEGLITPLVPCLKLCTYSSTNHINDSSNTNDGSFQLTNKEIASIKRVLGPCYTSIYGMNPSLHSNYKSKKKHTSGHWNYPLSNTNRFKFSLFEQLQVGPNNGHICVGRVLTELPTDSDLVLNFVLVDPKGELLITRLFNVGKGLGPVKKDVLAIPNPFIEEVLVEGFLLRSALIALSANDPMSDWIIRFTSAGLCVDRSHQIAILNDCGDSNEIPQFRDVRLRLLRIPLPNLLIVNGQPVDPCWTATPVLKNIFFTNT